MRKIIKNAANLTSCNEIQSALVEGKKEIQAIGVLGSDVYDKQLILQALRKKFPRAIFFTMDLDARLIHPAQRQWTRNLIVASHFGLQLNPTLQGTIPPFRDNSQTSLFYSRFAGSRAFARRILTPSHSRLSNWIRLSSEKSRVFSYRRTAEVFFHRRKA